MESWPGGACPVGAASDAAGTNFAARGDLQARSLAVLLSEAPDEPSPGEIR